MKKKKIIIGLVVLLIIIAAVYMIKGGREIEAEVAEVERGDVTSFIEETAVVKSKNQRTIYAQVVGEIREIRVEEGDFVKQGEVIAIIDTTKNDLQIKMMEAQLEGLKAAYREALKGADEEKIKQAEASVKSLQIKVEQARREVENSKKLYEEDAISYEAYKNAVDNLALQEESLKIAQNELALLKKSASSNILKQHQAKIRELQYQIELLEQTEKDLKITSSVSGTVLDVFIKEGTYLQPGTAMFEIGDINKLYIEADILIGDVGKIREGADVIITSDDLDMKPIKGKVNKIYPKAFSKMSDLGIKQKRVKIEIDLLEQSPELKVGYEVTVKIVTAFKNNVLYVPKSAVFELGNEKYVFVVENHSAALKKVETGIEGDDVVEIKAGLAEGETIILYPDNNMEEGVTIKEAVAADNGL